MKINFREINLSNVGDICNLKVYEHQEKFVASNTFSLAEAYACSKDGYFVQPFGIYDSTTPIGFIMIGYGKLSDPDDPPVADGNYILWRLMIDKEYQGKGYCKSVLQKVIEYVKSCPAGKADCIWLSYEKDNQHAQDIYKKFGFSENGQMSGDEIVAVYELNDMEG